MYEISSEDSKYLKPLPEPKFPSMDMQTSPKVVREVMVQDGKKTKKVKIKDI